MKANLVALLLSFLTLVSFSQKSDQEDVKADYSTLAVGAGLDYGGLGFSYTIYPRRNIGVFGSVGVIWGSLGYNFGVKTRVISKKKIQRINPFVKLMYGYNATFLVSNNSDLNKTFYGPSVGGGLDFNFNKSSSRKSYWSFSVIHAIVNDEAKDYAEYLENKLGQDHSRGFSSLRFSVGYNMIFERR